MYIHVYVHVHMSIFHCMCLYTVDSTSNSASSPSDATGAIPNPTNEWERHTLMNVVIVVGSVHTQ